MKSTTQSNMFPGSTMNTVYNDPEPRLYGVNDLRRIFHRGRRQTYDLMHQKGFPSFQIGKTLYVEHKALEKWIARQSLK